MADPERYGVERIEAYRIAHALALRIESMVAKLPALDRFDRGDQVRRSSGSVPAQITEGYGLRKYKDQFLLYLHRALASADETKEHLDHLFQAGKLKNPAEYSGLEAECRKLSAKLGAFIIGVERNHTLPYYLRKDYKPKTKGPTPEGKSKPSPTQGGPQAPNKAGLGNVPQASIPESRLGSSDSGQSRTDMGNAPECLPPPPNRESRIGSSDPGPAGIDRGNAREGLPLRPNRESRIENRESGTTH